MCAVQPQSAKGLSTGNENNHQEYESTNHMNLFIIYTTKTNKRAKKTLAYIMG